jgi:rubrerythrin
MAIFELERLFDPPAKIEARAREKAQDLAGARKIDDDPPRFRCRVCDHRSEAGEYCPTCLADTMVPDPTPKRP